MHRRRLILPPMLRGPLRLAPDAEHEGANVPRRPGGKVILVLLWLALCSGLYLIGNLPNGTTAPKADLTLPLATHPPELIAVTSKAPRTVVSQSVPPARAVVGPLKPLRDSNNLAVFGTGLERGPDWSSAVHEDAPPPSSKAEPAQDDTE